MVMVIDKEKKELREKLRRRLLSLADDEIRRRSENVEKTLSELPIYKQAKLIMVYYPLRGEVDILEMVRKAETKRFCFPVMDLESKDLAPFEVGNLDEDFIEGPWGVMQPNLSKAEEVNLREIDIAIVPGLAFDYQKNRLGRGGGFYDRFLKRIRPPTKKIGAAFTFQITKNLPLHPHLDQKVDLIVSENFII